MVARFRIRDNSVKKEKSRLSREESSSLSAVFDKDRSPRGVLIRVSISEAYATKRELRRIGQRALRKATKLISSQQARPLKSLLWKTSERLAGAKLSVGPPFQGHFFDRSADIQACLERRKLTFSLEMPALLFSLTAHRS